MLCKLYTDRLRDVLSIKKRSSVKNSAFLSHSSDFASERLMHNDAAT